MPDFKLIANPLAGRGAGERLLPAIRRTLREEGIDFDLVRTTRPLEAVELARQAAADGYQVIVAVGGDGMAHEVVNGMMREEATATLGIIPLGSANDFIKVLNVPPDPIEACRYLARGGSRLIDVGRVGDRYFVNAMGIGFDALVAIESQKIRYLTGLPRYLLALFRTLLLTYLTPPVTINLEGEIISQPVTMIAAANGRCLGGGFWVAPEAEIDDGLFDVLIADQMNRLGILRFIPEVMRGTHIDKEPVTMTRARHMVVDSAEPLPVHADGEVLHTDAHHLEMEVLPRRLRVIG